MSCWVPLYWVPSYCGHQWPSYIWLVNIKIRIKWTKHDYSQVKHEWPRNSISTIHLELLFGSQHPSSRPYGCMYRYKKIVTWVSRITWLENNLETFPFVSQTGSIWVFFLDVWTWTNTIFRKCITPWKNTTSGNDKFKSPKLENRFMVFWKSQVFRS